MINGLKQWRWLISYGMLALLGSLAAGYFTPRQWFPSTTLSCAQSPYRLYVAGDSLHVNLVFPVHTTLFDWRSFLALEQIGSDPGGYYQYLKFGWGDRDFYMNTPSLADMQLSRALRALFWPDNPTAMHVQGYAHLPQEPGVDLRCVGLSAQQYLQVVNFLQASFQMDTHHHPIRLGNAFGPASGFYAGTGSYSILRTCNTWAAEGLNTAGVNTPLWSALAPAIMRQLPPSSVVLSPVPQTSYSTF
jgi:uncharacterized protein (TIGR02117 family)